MNRLSDFIALPFVLIVFTASPAYAYLDPGTGSILLQGLIAGIAGVTVYFRSYWWRLMSFFRKSDEGPAEGDGDGTK